MDKLSQPVYLPPMEFDALIEVLSKPLHTNWIDSTRATTEIIKVWLLPVAILLALFWRRLPLRLARSGLLVLMIVSSLNYARWGGRVLTEQLDSYDLVHYYLNTKYFSELSYYDLYPAAILADHENNGPYFEEGPRYLAQDDQGHSVKPISHALQRGAWVRQNLFSKDRWAQFEHDLLYLQRETDGFTDTLWRRMIQDHGFNGTPVWTSVARPLTRIIPVEWVKGLCFIDLGLLLGAAGVTAWAFGWGAAAWFWIFLMVTYSTRWPVITWSYLRYDYITALVIGMALVKRGHYFLSGLFTGYGAVSRLFPAMWLYGPGMKGLIGLAQRVIHRPLLLLASGFLISAGTLQVIAWVDHPPETISIHFHNMIDHNSPEQLSSRRVGLALAMPYYPGQDVPKYIEPERKQTVSDQKHIRLALAGLVMLVLGWGLRNARDEEAYALGFIPFYLLTTASYYYYVARAPLFIMHAADLSKLRNRVGLAWLLGAELITNGAAIFAGPERVFLIGNLAWAMGGYTLLMTGWFVWESHHAEARVPDTDSASG